MWQGEEATDTEGSELPVKSFVRMRCPNCFNVVATVSLLGMSSDFTYTFRGIPGDITNATVSVTGFNEFGEQVEIANMSCHRAD
ncbi:MAG: hypothetical protein KDD34_04155 [Bdellovibrionales bacterium]|nr:hypothetical protein [Bdellovibrionales bacterium]